MLLKCDQISLLAAVIKCSQLGLEPGNGLGHVYLIPFFNKKKQIHEVQVIPGYRGLIELARRSGAISSIAARVVHEKDSFRVIAGDDERIEHVPFMNGEPGDVIMAYAIVRFKDGGIQREVMTVKQIDAIRRRSHRENPVWESDYEEMCRKTVVRRILKYVPASPEIAQVLNMEDEAERAYPVQEVYALSPMERQAELAEFDAVTQKLGVERAETILGRPIEVAREELLDQDIIKLTEAANKP